MLFRSLKYLQPRYLKTLTTARSSMALHISIDDINAESLAIDLLQKGQIIAVPTDTVYGLACCATNVDAINKLYSVKSRNEKKPLAICVGKVADIEKWAVVSHLPEGLLASLLPGPVTVVLNFTKNLHSSFTSEGKVGIRIPDLSFIRNIADGLNKPIALTSANVSNQQSSVKVEEFQSLWGEIAGVFDGGVLGVEDSNRNASTVVDLSCANTFKIIRPGIASLETVGILKRYELQQC